MKDSIQNVKSVAKNQDFFADNDWYKRLQSELELYQFIALSATHETAHARRLLDIGNGGVFIYPIDHIPDVHAVDIFVEEDFRVRYPAVQWHQMSALSMDFEQPFDTAVAINTLHHIIGDTVSATYTNLDTIMRQVSNHLAPDGKFVLLESTVPSWFIGPYKLIFPLLLKVWPLKHPPTFQFHFRDLLKAAENADLELEEFCWIPKTSDLMSLGFRIKPWMSPVQMGKFVFYKRTQQHDGKTISKQSERF